MLQVVPSVRYNFAIWRLLCGLTVSLLLLATAASGQSETNGSTPAGLSAGAPAGSYALSGFDNVNLFNGHMNFRLPLLGVGGRGGAAYKMALPVEQTWTVFKQKNEITGVVTYHPEPNWWTGIKPGYGAGVMQGRKGGSGSLYCGQFSPWYRYSKTLTRLTFTAGDGTEFELRDKLTDGQPQSPVNCTTGFNRGKVFATADGSSATFISDADILDTVIVSEDAAGVWPSGYLLLRDGTRYRIDNATITWMRDRNGNKLSFEYDSFKRMIKATDSLGREITVAYATQTPGSDVVTYKGFGAVDRTISVNYDWLQNALRSDQLPQTPKQLFPDLNGSSTTNYNPSVIKSVTLPNNQQYQLFYNSYGEVARAVLPTGGAMEYDYAAGLTDGAASGEFGGGANGKHVYRRVIERRVYPGGGSGSSYESKMTYSRPEANSTNDGYVVTDQCTPSGTTGQCGGAPALLGRAHHYFNGSARSSFFQNAVSYGSWTDGREYQTDIYDVNGTTLLRRVVNTFAQRDPVGWWTYDTYYGVPPNDPRLVETVSTLADTNQVTKQTLGYSSDLHNNQTDVWEYDYGSGSAPVYATRHTHTDYLVVNSANGINYADPANGTSYVATDIHIRSLARAQQVYSVNSSTGIETPAAQSETRYDESSYPLLPPYETITGWDNPGAARGLATTSRSWLNPTGTWLEAHARYDQVGNVRSAWDAKGNLSQVSYADSFSDELGRNTYALPTITISPVPNASGQYGSSSAFVATTVYDFWTGRATSTTDANGQTTSMQYSDEMDRPTQVTRAVATGVANQTTFDYDDDNNVITTMSDLNEVNDNALVSKVLYDGLGRTIETRSYEGGSNYIASQQQYDALGRAFKTSNPFRPWQSESAIWTTTGFDALGRVISVTTPDSAVVSTTYSGNTVTVTDQAVKKRKSVTDGLGRLKEVYEDPGTNRLNYLTSYNYDVLDNLTTVTQDTQTRTFVYDSLKRLTSATNPESGTISYVYDSNGNLTKKTDARGVYIDYVYDDLNRNITVNYSNTTIGDSNVPDITRLYDNATIGANGKGRFWHSYAGGHDTVGTTVEHTKILSYDELGRPLDQRQRFKTVSAWSAEYQTVRSYNLAGAVTSQTYPSGRSVSYTYDNAGRTTSFTGYLGDGAERSYSTEIVYSPLGGMTKEKFGTDTALYNKLFYNRRGQLAEIRVGTYHATDPT